MRHYLFNFMNYLIDYDLNSPGQNYKQIINEIEKYRHIKAMLSCWIIKTNLTSQQIYNSLSKHIDVNDRIIISEITSNHQGYLNQSVWDFINSN